MIPIRSIVLAVCLAATTVWFLRQPTRTRIPDKVTPVASVRAKFEALEARERPLVAGYLLRQRGEILSFPRRDEGPFTARTFGDAIDLQAEFLKANRFVPNSVVRLGLEDQALRPLRETVELVRVEAGATTLRQMFGIHPQASTRYGGPDQVAEQDKPLLKVTLFLRNLTDSEIEVTGVVTLRQAKPAARELGWHTSCYFKRKAIAPRMGERVECSNTQAAPGISGDEQRLLDSPKDDLHVIWTPREIRFADGRVLAFDEHAAARERLWGFYTLEGKD